MCATSKRKTFKTVDEYLKTFPPPVRSALEKIRKTIRTTAPGADEVISYGIPGYKYHGELVYFAGFKQHVSVYPAPRSADEFKKELAAYKGGKGTVQFPLDKPIPLDLVKRIVRFKVNANEEKAALKKKGPVAAKKEKKTKPSDADEVTTWVNRLSPAVKKDIQVVRKIIKGSSAKLSERIKWNAPSYYYVNDIVTFGPRRDDQVLLVFHHPAVVKIKSALLQGTYKDRRLVYLKNSKEAAKHKKELQRIIRAIILSIDKK